MEKKEKQIVEQPKFDEQATKESFENLILEKEKIDNNINTNFDAVIKNFELLSQKSETEISTQQELDQAKDKLISIQAEKGLAEDYLTDKEEFLQKNKKSFLANLLQSPTMRHRIKEARKDIKQLKSEKIRLNKQEKNLNQTLQKLQNQLTPFQKAQEIKYENFTNDTLKIASDIRSKYENLSELMQQNRDLKELLNEELVAQQITPSLEKIQLNKRLSESEVAEYLELFEYELQNPILERPLPDNASSDRQNRINRLEKLEKKGEIPYQNSYYTALVNNYYGYGQTFNLITRNEAYELLQELIKKIQVQELPLDLKEKLIISMQNIDVPKNEHGSGYRYWEIKKDIAKIPLDFNAVDQDDIFSEYYLTGASNTWDIIKNHSKLQKIFNKSNLDSLEKKIQNKVLARFIQEPDKTQGVLMRMKLINKETMPWLLMNTYKEKNLYARAEGFDKLLKESDQIGELDNPAQDIIEFIQKNPDVFEHVIDNPRKKELIEKFQQNNDVIELVIKENTYIDEIIFDNKNSNAVFEEKNKKWLCIAPDKYKEQLGMPDKVKKITKEDPNFYKVLSAIEKTEYPENWDFDQIKISNTNKVLTSHNDNKGLEITQENFNKLCKKLDLNPLIIEEPDKVDNPTYHELQTKLSNYAVDLMADTNNTDKQIFLIKFLQHLDSEIDLKENGYKILNKLLQERDNKDLQNAIIDLGKNKLSNILYRYDAEINYDKSSLILRVLRKNDPLLQDNPQAKIQISENTVKEFNAAINKLSSKAFKPTSELYKYKDFYLNQNSLRFIARHPEQIEELLVLPETLPDLFNEMMQNFISQNLEKLIAIPREKRSAYVEIFLKIDQSPSQEIQRLKDELLQEILNTEEPIATYKKIEDIFIHNNLPIIGKAYKIFETLHPPEKMKKELTSKSSPVLNSSSIRNKYYIIYKDLLKTHIQSANRSLREYAEVLLQGENVLTRLEKIGIDNLDTKEKAQLKYFFSRMNTLFVNSLLGKRVGEKDVDSKISLEQQYENLKSSLEVKNSQTITQRISQMFLRPIGLHSLEQVLSEMHQAKSIAHQRGLDLVQKSTNNYLKLETNDLLKGVQAEFISNILQNGSVAKEFLGSGASQDSTPFDTDLSKVLEQDVEQGFDGALNQSMAKDYGDLFFVIKNRGQCQNTETNIQKKYKYDPAKLELFEISERHYGIRTGFPSTQIDFMIAKDDLIQNQKEVEKIYYEIAQNGYYIPITNISGKIIFTPELYQEYRKTFDGLERFDAEKFEFLATKSSDSHFEQIQKIILQVQESAEQVKSMRQIIRQAVEKALEENQVQMKPEQSPSLVGAEFIDIGSTGRLTNVPGQDYDFDFTLKLDPADFAKSADIAHGIKEKFEFQAGDDHSHQEQNGYYQFSIDNIAVIEKKALDKPIKIDIGFTKKSDLAVFGSHNAVEEKLDWIRKNIGENAYEQTIANIILTKKILKKGQAYSRVEHGGFGGIGVENWILSNNGNMQQAFITFLKAAYKKNTIVPFEKFKENYKILNAGMNVKHLYHDNYTANLKEEGYQAMIKTIENYLNKKN